MAGVTMGSRRGEKTSGLRALGRDYYTYRYFFLMLLPCLAYFAIFHYGPMYGLVVAFKDYYPLKGVLASKWAGLKYFRQVFGGIFFWDVFRNTVLISFYKLVIGFPAPILLALLMNEVRHVKFKKAVQTITYLPHFLSWVILAGILTEFFSPARGAVNILLGYLGVEPIFFVAQPKIFRGFLVATGIWKNLGWNTIVYLAAISGVDTESYEVADLDGATRWQKMFYITVPSILPVVVIMLIFASGSIIDDDFDQVFNLLNDSVMKVGDVLSTYTYREGLQRMNYSYATAVGLFKNVISFVLVIATNNIAKRASDYAIW
ncbi:MAG TPA: ABC transporter permease subunit [Clostridia bacterium]|nr:ABC transporter permease subunit [Clostridia bacterium]